MEALGSVQVLGNSLCRYDKQPYVYWMVMIKSSGENSFINVDKNKEIKRFEICSNSINYISKVMES